jgi:hypothetical protein
MKSVFHDFEEAGMFALDNFNKFNSLLTHKNKYIFKFLSAMSSVSKGLKSGKKSSLAIYLSLSLALSTMALRGFLFRTTLTDC